ncbi:MAG: hypothetical protein Kow0074_17740 [Candidatus Zixiibacteriota bacterium]
MDCRVRQLTFSLTLAALAVVLGLFVPFSVHAQDQPTGTTMADTALGRPTPVAPLPASNVRAQDAPNDHGHALLVQWELSPDDGQGKNNVMLYRIERTPRFEGPFDPAEQPPGGEYRLFHSAVYNEAVWRVIPNAWDTVAEVPSGEMRYEDRGGKLRDANDFLPDHMDFQYRVVTVSADGIASVSAPSEPAQAYGQIVHWSKLGHIGIPVLVFTVLVLGFISLAKRGRELYIRPLAGISAVDEAIGRATEMNRPILYVLGLGAADEIGTIASFTILSRVAKKVAEHRTELLVPCYDAVVMSIAQETVKQAYLDAGRPDEYRDDIVYFVTQEQFAYVASVNGTMIRRQTATNFYLGVFFAESLILAETGSIAGSIQISGTDRTTQLPFFIVACDYTLIGEELYAASAYLGREPKLLGTLKAQDYAKSIFMIMMVIGILAAAFQIDSIVSLFEITF